MNSPGVKPDHTTPPVSTAPTAHGVDRDIRPRRPLHRSPAAAPLSPERRSFDGSLNSSSFNDTSSFASSLNQTGQSISLDNSMSNSHSSARNRSARAGSEQPNSSGYAAGGALERSGGGDVVESASPAGGRNCWSWIVVSGRIMKTALKHRFQSTIFSGT